jgi:hypothetical protein
MFRPKRHPAPFYELKNQTKSEKIRQKSDKIRQKSDKIRQKSDKNPTNKVFSYSLPTSTPDTHDNKTFELHMHPL